MIAHHSAATKANGWPILAHPFRVFFLAAACYAIVVVFAWLSFLFSGMNIPMGWAPLQWHSHEMLYGFVSAAITGFVLTALTNWTAAAPLRGGWLLALVGLWLAGRLAMWLIGWLPSSVVAVVDLAFLPVVALYVGVTLWRHQNYRNLALVFVLSLLFAGNVCMHLGFVSGKSHWLNTGQIMGLDLVALLIAIIAGRIIPAFTQNWLRTQGHNLVLKRSQTIDIVALVALAAILVADTLSAPAAVIGWLAGTAAAVHALRLVTWFSWKIWREPLLWVLHLGYFWLVCALALRSFGHFWPSFSNSVWLHAMGVGAIGTLILAVMVRVAVGHTGRPLALLRWGWLIFVAISAAAVLRLLVALGLFDFRLGVNLSAIAWVLAFAVFIALYGPILVQPRADGRPG